VPINFKNKNKTICQFAVMNFLSFFFYKKYIVETKGKSLEELELEKETVG
jgi:hypothetical protein